MSTDDPDAEDLAEAFPHVAQLEKELKEADIDVGDIPQRKGTTRRDLLAGSAGLLGLGGILTAGSGTAAAGDDQVGSLGTDSNRLDAEIEDLDLTDQSSTPSGPGAGQVRLYAREGTPYYKAAGGSETQLGGGGGTGIFEDTNSDGVFEQTTGAGIEVPSVDAQEFNDTVKVRTSDGATAIADAVDKIPAGERRALSFEAGGVFPITSEQTIPLEKVSAVHGNGAYLRFDSDVSVTFAGNNTTTAVPKNGNNRTQSETEMGVLVSGLRAYSSTDPFVGRVTVDNAFGLVFSGCHFAKLHTGIEFAGECRNLVLGDSHIYDCQEYCLRFAAGSDIHQFVAANNHISYARVVVRYEDGEYADHFYANNDFEADTDAAQQQTIEQIVDIALTSGAFFASGFANNTFEPHGQGTCIRATAPDTASFRQNRIVNNTFTAAPDVAVNVSFAENLNIAENNISLCDERAITLGGELRNVNVSNNQIYGPAGDGIVVETDEFTLNLRIDGNQFMSWDGRAVHMTELNSGTSMREISINANIVFLGLSSSFNGQYVFDVNNDGAVLNLHMMGNKMRGRDVGEAGFRVDSTSSTFDHLILKNNIIEANVTNARYSFPSESSTIIVGDNI